MGGIRIALAQIDTTVGDLDGNVELVAGSLDRARAEEADLVLFPELTVSGFPPEGLVSKPDFLADCRRSLERIARLTEGIAALVGFPGASGSSAALVADGRVLGTCGVFEIQGFRCLVAVGEDLYAAREAGAEVVFNLSALPFRAGAVRRAHDARALSESKGAGEAGRRYEAIAEVAKSSGAYVCRCNLVGGQDEFVFDGGSVIVGPEGEVVASAKRFEEDLLVADIDIASGAALDGGEGVTIRSIRSRRSGPRKALVARASREQPPYDEVGEIRRALVLGTRDYAKKNGFGGAVIGLSGGVDSSLVAALAVEALGEDSVVGVTMPSRFSSRETMADAEGLARNLGLRLLTIPIEPAFEAFEKMLDAPFAEGESGAGAALAMENVQARIRATILMALSNRFGWLVLTTGNRSEAAVGYCTLYGDTAGGFAALKYVPKTLVYDLAGHVNERAGHEIIPQSVIDRPPSAELKDGQKDEDSLPPYDVLDRVLEAYLDRDAAADEIAKLGVGSRLVRDVIRMVHRSEFKRRQSPPGVNIKPDVPGSGGRLPITNRYR